MIYLKLFLTFFEIGAVSFGGGYGMISLIREIVLANAWLTENDFVDFIAVAESTPGPIAVNMATFIGTSQGGVLGALAATLGGGIAAAIIADDEFVIEVGLLEHHTAYGLIDILLLVVGEHQHAHLDVSVHNVSFLSSKRMASLSILLPVA